MSGHDQPKRPVTVLRNPQLVAPPALYLWQTPAMSPAQQPTDISPDAGIAQQQVTLIASVPLACEGWQPMKEGEIIAVRSGEILETLFI